jgi:hypothetical protein
MRDADPPLVVESLTESDPTVSVSPALGDVAVKIDTT